MDNARQPFLDASKYPLKLCRLYELRDGWLDGAGRAPSHEGLNWLRAAWQALWPLDLPLPYVYPTEQGGVSLEWSQGPISVSLDICLVIKAGELQAVEVVHGTVLVERNLELAGAAGWAGLIANLRQHVYPTVAPAPAVQTP